MQMEGPIVVQSRPGEGSTFKVSIPLRIATEEERNPRRTDIQPDKTISLIWLYLLGQSPVLHCGVFR